jgi:hypothetical protein
VDVEEDEPGALGGDRRPGFVERPGLPHAELLQLEVDAGEEPEVGIVFDDEDGRLL